MDEMSLYISSGCSSDPEKGVNLESSLERHSDSALLSLKMGVAIKRKRSSVRKSFSNRGNQNIEPTGAGCRGNNVDNMELCAKRMKNMFLSSVRSSKMNGANVFRTDDGYDGDSEA